MGVYFYFVLLHSPLVHAELPPPGGWNVVSVRRRSSFSLISQGDLSRFFTEISSSSSSSSSSRPVSIVGKCPAVDTKLCSCDGGCLLGLKQVLNNSSSSSSSSSNRQFQCLIYKSGWQDGVAVQLVFRRRETLCGFRPPVLLLAVTAFESLP